MEAASATQKQRINKRSKADAKTEKESWKKWRSAETRKRELIGKGAEEGNTTLHPICGKAIRKKEHEM